MIIGGFWGFSVGVRQAEALRGSPSHPVWWNCTKLALIKLPVRILQGLAEGGGVAHSPILPAAIRLSRNGLVQNDWDVL